ncbi:hypothetical protein GK047_16640 [Paenibacillus sp. SYP-B3998]|uniref:Uncharacterized protein n=1 Tax=Paenibacillus sp. SYP-B3998 TaxID=2678564 RepID=A0A6G4A1D0_9BACL|nr:hypothetical protein [Paenibacillus sp. SYP-B3998]NEW07631.1 hypothetical protein [Paenibacillus sp. SYP-B3998]
MALEFDPAVLWHAEAFQSATVVSSLIVVMIVCQYVGNFSLYSNIAVPIGLALLGAAVAYMSIRNIEHIDVLK